MPHQPLVTTIIPTHNRAQFLTGAIESVLAQELPDHEVIVVDDSSTDNTAEIASRYPVRYLCVKSGKPSRTRNAGIRAANGKYLAFLDDDDVWLPDRFHPALERLEADAGLAMVYGQYLPADVDLNVFGAPYPAEPMAQGQPVFELMQTVVLMTTTVIRRSVLEEIGPFNEDVFGSEDMDLTVRLVRKHRCAAIATPVCLVRFHTARPLTETSIDGVWTRFRDSYQLTRTHVAIADRFQRGAWDRQRLLQTVRGFHCYLFLELAQRYRDVGNAAMSRRAARFAWKAAPLHSLKSPHFWRYIR